MKKITIENEKNKYIFYNIKKEKDKNGNLIYCSCGCYAPITIENDDGIYCEFCGRPLKFI